MKINIKIIKPTFDFYLKWMADSWPQFSSDRYTESNVEPKFFPELFHRTKFPHVTREIINDFPPR